MFDEMIQKFDNTYEDVIKFLNLTLDKCNSTLQTIKDYKEVYKILKRKQAVYTVANFGYPNCRKSSSFNFLMTGSYDFPLPNSSKTDVEGETLKPCRCRFIDSNDLELRKNNFTGELVKSFKTIDNKDEILDLIKKMMTDEDVEEIIIQLPGRKFKDQYNEFRNFVFLDLIGISDEHLNFNEDEITKLNRLAVEKQQIDAIFLFPGKRSRMDNKIIESLWKTGLFSDLNERPPPKLINTMKIMKNKDWQNNRSLGELVSGFKKGFTKASLLKSICELFDFSDFSELENLLELNETIKQLNKKDEAENKGSSTYLEIENKCKSVTSMIKRAASICIIELNINESNDIELETHKEYLENLKNIKNDIIVHKDDQTCRDLLEYILIMSDEILKKINTCLVSLMKNKEIGPQRYLDLINSILKPNKRPLRYQNSTLKSILEEFKNEVLESDEINESIITRRLKINSMLSQLIKKISNTNYEFLIERSNEIKIKYPNDDINIDIKVETNKIRQSINEIRSDYNYNDIISENGINQLCEKLLEKLKVYLAETYYYGFYVSLSAEEKESNYKKILNNHKQSIVKIKNIILEKIKKENPNNENIPNDYYPTPILFSVQGSNKLPVQTEIEVYNSKIHIAQIKNFCKDFKKPEPFFHDMLIEGKKKSELKIKHIDCNQKEFIQFYIDRENKSITAEYNKSFIDTKTFILMKNLYEPVKNSTSRSLYPIFISSRLRGYDYEKNQYLDLNIIANDLLKAGIQKDCFLIFLFIEAGTDKNRDLFKNEIDYYNKLKQKHCPCDDSTSCPIVLCYLPERDLGIGRKRKIMMMFAEHLMLRRYYLIDDDIEYFYEYDHRLGQRIMRSNDQSTFKALKFMEKVLEDSILNDKTEIDPDKLKKWTRFISSKNGILYDELYDILYEKMLIQSKCRALDLINKLLIVDNDDLILKEIKSNLLGDKSKHIGQVSLWNRLQYNKQYENRLQGEKPRK